MKKKEKNKIYVGLARDIYTCHVISTILNLVSLLGLVQTEPAADALLTYSVLT